MKINFIGAPCSGKTTTAAMLFAALKESGVACEFITEQARLYIAKLRVFKQLKPEDKVELFDFDQYEIMRQQYAIESMFKKATGSNSVIISDSSPLNSLLYMTEDYLQTGWVQEITRKTVAESDLVFYVPPVVASETLDPNRIHSEEQSRKIDDKIPALLQLLAPEIWNKIYTLQGTTDKRLSEATAIFLTEKLK